MIPDDAGWGEPAHADGPFHPHGAVGVLAHHSFSADLEHYDLLVEHFYGEARHHGAFRYRFTHCSDVTVRSQLSRASRADHLAEEAESPGMDGEAVWGVPINQILTAEISDIRALSDRSRRRIRIETSAQLIELGFEELELEEITGGYTTFVFDE